MKTNLKLHLVYTQLINEHWLTERHGQVYLGSCGLFKQKVIHPTCAEGWCLLQGCSPMLSVLLTPYLFGLNKKNGGSRVFGIVLEERKIIQQNNTRLVQISGVFQGAKICSFKQDYIGEVSVTNTVSQCFTVSKTFLCSVHS